MKNPDLKVPPVGSAVRVDWLDSVDQPGWHYIGIGEKIEYGLRPAMQTRGVLVAVDADSLAVAQTIAPRGPSDLKEGHLDVLAIPKGCVVSLRVIP